MTTTPQNTARLAITGVNGFPGVPLLRWLDQCLEQGEGPLAEKYSEIVALDIRAPKDKLSRTRFYKIDLTEPAVDQKIARIFKDENVRAVVHLAFHYSPTKKSAYEHELHSIGTMYLLNACASQNVEKIVLHSTTYCYGAFPNNPNFLTEEHPLRGSEQAPFIGDRVDVERQIGTYRKTHPDCVVTILRPCATVGPNIRNFATTYLGRKICMTPLGFDPLVQVVHEDDVLRAFQLALEKDKAGAFNIVGEGVLPLLTLLHMGGRMVLPVASSVLHPIVQLLWQADVAVVPPTYLNFLRYLWVADGRKAKDELDFVPRFTTREAVLSFYGEQRLKQVHLRD